LHARLVVIWHACGIFQILGQELLEKARIIEKFFVVLLVCQSACSRHFRRAVKPAALVYLADELKVRIARGVAF
jgi:hypothetical protein